MAGLRTLIRDAGGAAAAEMALVMPFLILLMAGSMELGNYFLTEHAVTKQVQDGARYASRLTLATTYSCTASPSTVFQDPDAQANIINVTKTGSVDGTGTGRFASGFWTAGSCAAAPVSVSIRCVDKTEYGGFYAGLDGDIPVVKVSADVTYPSLLGTLGFNTAGYCVHANSEAVVAGI